MVQDPVANVRGEIGSRARCWKGLRGLEDSGLCGRWENQGLCLSYPYHNVMEKRRPAVAALYGESSNIDIVLD